MPGASGEDRDFIAHCEYLDRLGDVFQFLQTEGDLARELYKAEVGIYRQTVLTKQVEDNLSGIRILSREAKTWAEDVRISRQATQIALNEYQAGTQAYTTVVTAEAQQLLVEELLLSTQAQIQTDAVNLVVALGGGWSQSKLPDALADAAAAAPAPPLGSQ